tara:strand:- start:281 stop:457 length:177 start_codon:yes stop_codon:yes gene_type:complete
MDITPEQALNILNTAAKQSKMNYQDHLAVEKSVVLLAKALGMVSNPPEEETTDDGEVQ